jgi:hypothetical protein
LSPFSCLARCALFWGCGSRSTANGAGREISGQPSAVSYQQLVRHYFNRVLLASERRRARRCST